MGIKWNNITLCAAFVIFLLLILTVMFSSDRPSVIPCASIIHQRAPCQQQRQDKLRAACKRYNIPEDDPLPPYNNIFIDPQSKLLICGFQQLLLAFAGERNYFQPLSWFTEERQKEFLKSYTRILMVRHPFVKVLGEYQKSDYSFEEFVDMVLASEVDVGNFTRDCLPCSVHYHHVVKYESLRADMAYLSASLGPRNADTCAVLKPPEEAFYTEVLAEYDQLSMTQLSLLLLRHNTDMMLFDYRWKMNVAGKGVIVLSDDGIGNC